MNTKKDKTEIKKEHVAERINKLDPNNNKNLEENPVIEKDGKEIHDDGFEHRKSEETA